jgi:uncharacterized protein YjbJ (UPF0337 family)
MSMKGSIKEAAGFVKEETGEKLHNQKMAQEGRDLRNRGRVEDGKMPKLTKPGTGHRDEE